MNVFVTLKAVDEILKCDLSNEIHREVLLLWCCLLCCRDTVFLTFESADKILKSDHSNESYGEVISCGVVSVEGGSNFESVVAILKCDHADKFTEQYFPMVLFILLHKMVLNFEF